MKFLIITIFPDFVRSVFEFGVLRRAVEAGLISYGVVDPRDFTEDRHRTTDDAPYGGGPGMVMLAEPLYRAISALREEHGAQTPVIYLSPSGMPLSQGLAEELAKLSEVRGRKSEEAKDPALPDCEASTEPDQSSDSTLQTSDIRLPTPALILLCGRYEGIDQRLLDEIGAREVSIGDYVLSGGELAAMVLVDAVARLLPGVLGNEDSSGTESFAGRGDGAKLLDWPHYTRPEIWRGRRVPEVLLSGNHAKILSFRENAALLLTFRRRPELLSAELRQRAESLLDSLQGRDAAEQP
ncbi:tRNA (guanine(37)-N(1))-methyltransferase [bacterium]|nr:tRNA (guanine(37)-N(1))-methyltransferase [bacterium]